MIPLEVAMHMRTSHTKVGYFISCYIYDTMRISDRHKQQQFDQNHVREACIARIIHIHPRQVVHMLYKYIHTYVQVDSCLMRQTLAAPHHTQEHFAAAV